MCHGFHRCAARLVGSFARAELDRNFTVLARWKKSVDGSRLDPESVDLWRSTPKRDFWRIRWTSDLNPMTTCTYYTDGSQQQNDTVDCAFLAVAEDQIVVENQLRLTDGAEVFAAEIHTIKQAITDAQGAYICLDSRSVP